jgi:hypothetical protein
MAVTRLRPIDELGELDELDEMIVDHGGRNASETQQQVWSIATEVDCASAQNRCDGSVMRCRASSPASISPTSLEPVGREETV